RLSSPSFSRPRSIDWQTPSKSAAPDDGLRVALMSKSYASRVMCASLLRSRRAQNVDEIDQAFWNRPAVIDFGSHLACNGEAGALPSQVKRLREGMFFMRSLFAREFYTMRRAFERHGRAMSGSAQRIRPMVWRFACFVTYA